MAIEREQFRIQSVRVTKKGRLILKLTFADRTDTVTFLREEVRAIRDVIKNVQ